MTSPGRTRTARDPGSIRHAGSGKVRELFHVGDDKLLLVASDRISAYDVILTQQIPDKGKVLTGLSAFWFEALGSTRNHLISYKQSDLPDVGFDDLAGRAMLCKLASPLPVEFAVRGYLAGSGFKDYKATAQICGHELPDGLVESEILPHAIVTPATKATTGHDENITERRAAEIAGAELYAEARDIALEIYTAGASMALERGIIIADTKFEFGVVKGEVVLIDEVLTPDSSRFWPVDTYEPGRPQASFDKQYVRDWLDSAGWDHNPPPPDLPDDVVANTRSRYIEAYERITARPFESWLEEVRE